MSDSPKEPMPLDETLKRVWWAQHKPRLAPKKKAKRSSL